MHEKINRAQKYVQIIDQVLNPLDGKSGIMILCYLIEGIWPSIAFIHFCCLIYLLATVVVKLILILYQ